MTSFYTKTNFPSLVFITVLVLKKVTKNESGEGQELVAIENNLSLQRST